MTRPWLIAALSLGFAANGPAWGCRTHARLEPADVRFADAVVVGRIVNYRIVRDFEFRRKMLASPNLPATLREVYQSRTATLMTDHARFDILVDQVLGGRATGRITATWYNSTFGIPESLPAGPQLIALRRPSSPMPPLRGPSATMAGDGKSNIPTVLQAPCSSPFMFPIASAEARTVRRILSVRRQR